VSAAGMSLGLAKKRSLKEKEMHCLWDPVCLCMDVKNLDVREDVCVNLVISCLDIILSKFLF
jgi:hypothetical protein